MHIGQRHPVQLGVVGDIKDTLQALLPRVVTADGRELFVMPMSSDTRRRSRRRRLGRLRVSGGLIYGQYLTSIINRKAAEDALFAADDGTCGVWMLRDDRSEREAADVPQSAAWDHGERHSVRLSDCRPAQPGRQVVCVAGDGGIYDATRRSDYHVSEKLPIKIAVYDNGKLGFVELEQKERRAAADLHRSQESGLRQGRTSNGPLGPHGH